MLEDLPIAVAASKYMRGVKDLSGQAEPLQLVQIQRAFATAWQTDAHFVCYRAVNTGQDLFPRLTKPVLLKLRSKGAEVVTRVFGFDYDNPGHKPWTDELYQDFFQRLHTAAARWPLAGCWSLLYTTKHGARLMYVLDKDIPVDEAEGKHRWMVKQFGDAGLPVDPLSDWTRLFRFPYVYRDGKPTWQDGQQVYYYEQWHSQIDPTMLPELEKLEQMEYGNIREFTDPMPNIAEAEGLLMVLNPHTQRRQDSGWTKAAKRRLKGKDCYACCFEHAPLAMKGSRDTTLHQYVGTAIANLYRMQGTTPTHIFALFLECVQQLQPDSGTPDWVASLWSKVGRLWVLEEAKVGNEERELENEAEKQLHLSESVLEGMRNWSKSPLVHHTDAKTAHAWAQRHMIASIKKCYYIVNPDGLFDEVQLSSTEVVPRLQILGMDKVIPTKYQLDDGSWRNVTIEDLIRKHATIVTTVRAIPEIEGGYIENIDTGSSCLVIPSFRRNKSLEPTYDEEVDEWLKALFGSKYEKACEWLAWAPAFEEGPICGLSLRAPAGCGKKMLAIGLSETLEQPMLAGAQDLISQNQYGLLRSPYLNVDEGWPDTRFARHPADSFRSLVGGEPFFCNTKYEVPVRVHNPVRVIFTANNTNVVEMLTAGRNLSPEDREALLVRLMHFTLDETAAVWLRQKGGLSFTSRPGRRWVGGDGGSTSDYIIAKHILYLHKNRSKPVHCPSGRFLIEGDQGTDLMFEMRTNSGAAPFVIEAIVKLMNLANCQKIEGMVIQDYRLFVTVSTILEYYRNHMTQASREKLSAQIISNVLKGLVVYDWQEPFTLRSRPELTRRRWSEIDCELLLKFCRRDGWNCPVLEKLVDDRQLARQQGLLDSRLIRL